MNRDEEWRDFVRGHQASLPVMFRRFMTSLPYREYFLIGLTLMVTYAWLTSGTELVGWMAVTCILLTITRLALFALKTRDPGRRL